MPLFGPPLSGKEIRKACRATVAAIEDNDLYCCVFGSVACAIYGTEREPNDVDIIILSHKDPEEIKDMIESYDDRFYLVPSANPENTYRILWYALPNERACKIDILVPGLLSIPHIPTQNIVYQEPFQDIPLIPLLALTLLKLRGWTDHRSDSRKYMLNKVPIDEDDIDDLLSLCVEEYKIHLEREVWMPAEFVHGGRERVKEFIKAWPDSEAQWIAIGLTSGEGES